MDLRKATLDQILMELARRDCRFLFMLMNSERAEGEMHYCNVTVKQAAKIVDDAQKLVHEMLSGNKPENVSLIKRIVVNGKLVEQKEVEDMKDALDDPWSIDINKIGEYNPWKNEEKKDEDDDPWEKS